MNIGLYFGSFNPIHVGHLVIANVMVEKAGLDQVWFVVSPQNPFKSNGSLAHEFDRLDMVRAAIHDNYKFQVSDAEFQMPKPSYTVDTMAVLTDKYPQHQFQLIIGEDNLAGFKKWKNYQAILDFYGLCVYPRPDSQPSELRTHPSIQMIDAPLLNISATFIRDCIRQGQSIKYLVPDSVIEIIESRKLYR